MILASLVAKSLLLLIVVPVAVDRSVQWPPPERGTAMSRRSEGRDGRAAGVVRDRMHRAHGFGRSTFSSLRGAEFNNLIVESVPSCVDALRSMIDAYDRLFGDGAGETFFMGPYLDGLPAAVHDPRSRTPARPAACKFRDALIAFTTSDRSDSRRRYAAGQRLSFNLRGTSRNAGSTAAQEENSAMAPDGFCRGEGGTPPGAGATTLMAASARPTRLWRVGSGKI